MTATQVKKIKRNLRRGRVRSKVSGTAQRPRLAVFRSAAHIYAQLIDDASGQTLAAADSRPAKGQKVAAKKVGKKIDAAAAVGKLIAAKAKDKNISTVVFDRGGYKYHGRVKAVADAARAAGLQF